MRKSGKSTVGAWVSEECRKELQEVAAKKNLSVSELIKTLLTDQVYRTLVFESIPGYSGGEAKHQVKVRLTSSELEAFDAVARATSLTRQKLLVSFIRSALASDPIVTAKEVEVLLESAVQLKKVGVNINQIAHVLNEERKNNRSFKGDEIRQFFELAEALNTRIDIVADQVMQLISVCRDRCLIRRKRESS